MNLPDLPDFSHFPIIKDAVEFIVKQALSQIMKRIGGEPVVARVERMRESLDALAERLAALEKQIAANDEIGRGEPALVSFVREALETASDSTSEAKRRLLGDAIAERFVSNSDSTVGVALHVALRIISDATEAQLILLGATQLKESSTVVSLTGEAEMESWLTRNYGALIGHPFADKYTLADLDHLESLGAVRQGSRNSGSFLASGSSFAALWLRKRGLEVQDRPRFDRESQPILARWTQMLSHPSAEEHAEGRGPSIEDVHLTPAGGEIARMVVRRLSAPPSS